MNKIFSTGSAKLKVEMTKNNLKRLKHIDCNGDVYFFDDSTEYLDKTLAALDESSLPAHIKFHTVYFNTGDYLNSGLMGQLQRKETKATLVLHQRSQCRFSV